MITVTDGDGNVTTIERDASGNPTGIAGPFGQRTTLTVDANGFLANVMNPAGEAVSLTSTADGLVRSLTDPQGGIHLFSYDVLGRLTLDEDPVGGFTALARKESSANSYTVTLKTALGRTSTYLVEDLSTGGTHRLNTDPTGAQVDEQIGTDGSRTTTSPDGMVFTALDGPDPRFGMQASLVNSLTATSPSGLQSALTSSRSVTLTDPTNPLSLATLIDTRSINGRTYTSTYDASLKQLTQTTPDGRQTVATFNVQGRPLSIQNDPVLEAASFTYDSVGRLTKAQQGSQASNYTYDTLGRLDTQTFADGSQTQFAYDDANRLTQTIQPSGRTYRFTYDANGNRTQVVMPNGSVHGLGYTVVDLNSNYTPPGNPPYTHDYSLDKELIRTTLPSGRTVDSSYDSGGRPTGMSYAEATIALAYNDATQRVGSINRIPVGGGSGLTIDFNYDGSLLTQATWSGVAQGRYSYRYDNNFFLVGLTLNNDPEVALARDADGLLTGYGPFTLTRGGPAGAPSLLSDGTLSVAMTYDSLGRMSSRTHFVGGQPAYQVQLSYNNVGLIVRRVETVGGNQPQLRLHL